MSESRIVQESILYIQSCRQIYPKSIQQSIFKAKEKADNRSIKFLAGERRPWPTAMRIKWQYRDKNFQKDKLRRME